MYRRWGKRLLDVLLSATALLLCLPLLLVLALLLFLVNSGEVFFLQRRPGKDGRLFLLYKFKSMTDARNAAGELLPDEQRLTPVGRFIRALSLDELLQLLNVLKGDMSLVGPRPLLADYLPLYSPQQRRRHEVLPGITGLAQIHGRNLVTWEEKFAWDIAYVDTLSLTLDLKILLLTAYKVFVREGISSASAATMERFTGVPETRVVDAEVPRGTPVAQVGDQSVSR